MTEQLAAAIEKASRVRQSAPIDLALKKPRPDHH